MFPIIHKVEKLPVGVGYLAALTILPLIVATVYEVLSRRLFGEPTIWAYELGYMITGAHFLLGAALTLARGGHVRIDLIYDRLSPRGRALIDFLFYTVLYLPFLLLLCNALWGYMAQAYLAGETTGQSAWNPPIWPFRLIFFIGFAALTVQTVLEILKSGAVLFGVAPPEDPSEGPSEDGQ